MSILLHSEGLAFRGRLGSTSLSAPEGELCCLIGPNGSGKTSLLHALARIGRPAGKVRVAGVDLHRLGPAQRRRLYSYLPASRDVVWPISARDMIALGLHDRYDYGSIDAIARALELEPLLDRKMNRLSTGERSRVLIARALVAQPQLMLLDEPVANLDPKWQLALMDLLHSLTARGVTAIVAMHDLDLAFARADRLIVMDAGAVIADDRPEAVAASDVIRTVFEVEKIGPAWRPVSRPEDPRSSR